MDTRGRVGVVAYLLILRCGGRRGWFWPGRDMPSEREKCGRRGRYPLDRLIESYGINAKLFVWSDEITGDYPRKRSSVYSKPPRAYKSFGHHMYPNSGIDCSATERRSG